MNIVNTRKSIKILSVLLLLSLICLLANNYQRNKNIEELKSVIIKCYVTINEANDKIVTTDWSIGRAIEFNQVNQLESISLIDNPCYIPWHM